MDALEKYASKKKLTDALGQMLYGKDPRKVMGKSNAAMRRALRYALGARFGMRGFGRGLYNSTSGRGVLAHTAVGAGTGALLGQLLGAGTGSIRKMLPGHRKALKAYAKRKTLTNVGIGGAGGAGLAGLAALVSKKGKD